MRAGTLAILPFFACAACDTGSVSGDDDGADDDGAVTFDAAVFIDAPPADEPDGLDGITAAHNQVRAAHGVPPLTWDPALAAIAQAWAEQCVDDEAPTGLIDHIPGRSDNYPEYVGENVYGTSGQPVGTDAVALWIEEEADYDYPNNTCSGICGHYTQVVWAATTKVGCGIHICDGLAYGGTVVCDYAPGGNDGSRPY